jgi:hypothetical protein
LFDDIVAFRALAEIELCSHPQRAAQLREAHRARQQAATWSGWASSWIRSSPAAADHNTPLDAAADASLTDSDWQRL